MTGVRTTQTIAVGKIGNDRPISIVTEVWTSPELKTIVLSKRNDPRMGEQTFKLTNIQRGEPDPSLFTVPSDFKITEGGAKTDHLSDQAVGHISGQGESALRHRTRGFARGLSRGNLS